MQCTDLVITTPHPLTIFVNLEVRYDESTSMEGGEGVGGEKASQYGNWRAKSKKTVLTLVAF